MIIELKKIKNRKRSVCENIISNIKENPKKTIINKKNKINSSKQLEKRT